MNLLHLNPGRIERKLTPRQPAHQLCRGRQIAHSENPRRGPRARPEPSPPAFIGCNTYNRDYQGEDEKSNQRPSLNIFTRRDGKIYHFYNTELLFAPHEPGMDGRHVDMIWPIWNLFDFTPEGRGTNWYPKLKYPETADAAKG